MRGALEDGAIQGREVEAALRPILESEVNDVVVHHLDGNDILGGHQILLIDGHDELPADGHLVTLRAL